MTCELPTAPVPVPVPVKTPTKGRSNNLFRPKRTPLPRDDAQRQGDISSLAFLTMGGRDPAVAFLNDENPALGGRPLAVATASAEGYARVAAAIHAWSPGPAAG
ncbi:antitoxin Xre/MbcA/ParS toxin-binding domain-containing protein [Sphingopyxis sp. JAI128]|uniref:antitoxin Xre/MbcA/ParS toxin-binding domain-containing protein n=1 Tax=Sphingopyxis sp. JAI128 TaxID=2723066 RepID=UPI00160A0134|nr:antitoxin Xre/MbcA/ParS toxin-binding domain-containing protein [Sphingopyxis sp. JAI128]MBB6425417.1 hypothetical protein [Sphingopyxis sp. JAI128]